MNWSTGVVLKQQTCMFFADCTHCAMPLLKKAQEQVDGAGPYRAWGPMRLCWPRASSGLSLQLDSEAGLGLGEPLLARNKLSKQVCALKDLWLSMHCVCVSSCGIGVRGELKLPPAPLHHAQICSQTRLHLCPVLIQEVNCGGQRSSRDA